MRPQITCETYKISIQRPPEPWQKVINVEEGFFSSIFLHFVCTIEFCACLIMFRLQCGQILVFAFVKDESIMILH